MKFENIYIFSPLLSFANRQLDCKKNNAFEKNTRKYLYATIYLLKTCLAKRPKAPV
jgi:hypothetical protein